MSRMDDERSGFTIHVIPEAVWWLTIAGQAVRLYLGGIFHRVPPVASWRIGKSPPIG